MTDTRRLAMDSSVGKRMMLPEASSFHGLFSTV